MRTSLIGREIADAAGKRACLNSALVLGFLGAVVLVVGPRAGDAMLYWAGFASAMVLCLGWVLWSFGEYVRTGLVGGALTAVGAIGVAWWAIEHGLRLMGS